MPVLGGGDADFLNTDGKFETQISDQTSPTIIVPLNRSNAETTLTIDAARDERIIAVASVIGAVIGEGCIITCTVTHRFYVGHIVAINANNITLDSPLDSAFAVVCTFVNFTTHNMAVDGSVTPQIFSLRAAEPPAGLDVTVDVTRIIIACVCTSAVDLSKFGDLDSLLNGLLIRRVDGDWFNIFNAKSNLDLANYAFDFDVFSATNPAQGVDGFVCRLTFAGTNKMGVAIRVGPGEDIQGIVSDALDGLVELSIIVEGHVVVP